MVQDKLNKLVGMLVTSIQNRAVVNESKARGVLVSYALTVLLSRSLDAWTLVNSGLYNSEKIWKG